MFPCKSNDDLNFCYKKAFLQISISLLNFGKKFRVRHSIITQTKKIKERRKNKEKERTKKEKKRERESERERERERAKRMTMGYWARKG